MIIRIMLITIKLPSTRTRLLMRLINTITRMIIMTTIIIVTMITPCCMISCDRIHYDSNTG